MPKVVSATRRNKSTKAESADLLMIGNKSIFDMPELASDEPRVNIESPLLRFHNNLSGDRVTVVVGQGDEKTEFNFPKALLCSRCAWFRTAFRDGRFAEGKNGIITLPDDSPSAFMAFEYYVYYEDLAFLNLTTLPDVDRVQWSEHLEQCFEIWVLGDKYHMPGLQNTVMLRACEVLKRDMKTEVTDEMLAFCFKHTLRGSPLRKLAVEYIVWSIELEGQKLEDFESISGLDGFASEIYGALDAYHTIPRADFPRYTKAVKYEDLFWVVDVSAVLDSDCATEDVANGYCNWQTDQTCEDCGLWDAAIRNNEGELCWHCYRRTCHCREKYTAVCNACHESRRKGPLASPPEIRKR